MSVSIFTCSAFRVCTKFVIYATKKICSLCFVETGVDEREGVGERERGRRGANIGF